MSALNHGHPQDDLVEVGPNSGGAIHTTAGGNYPPSKWGHGGHGAARVNDPVGCASWNKGQEHGWGMGKSHFRLCRVGKLHEELLEHDCCQSCTDFDFLFSSAGR